MGGKGTDRHGEGAGPAGRRWRVLLLALFLLALALRGISILEAADSPYHRHLVLDAATYHRIAVRGDPREPFWQPPLYPWFLRAVYRLAGGPAPAAARGVQAALGALSAVLAALLAARFVSRRWALLAGLLVALWGPLVYFDGEILPASLAAFLLLALTLLVSAPGRWGRLPAAIPPLVSGLLLGIGGVLLPSLALAGGLLLLWGWRTRGWRWALVFAAAAWLPILPVAARNARFDEGRVLVSWNGGVNFYIGNHRDYPETIGIRPGIRWGHLVEQPRCRGGARTRAEEDAWFWRAGLGEIAAAPGRWLAHLAEKVGETWNRREIGRNREIYDAREESVVLRVLLQPWGLPFLLLAALVPASVSAAIRRRAIPWPVLLAALGVLAVSLVFFPTARYRAPALPLLIVLAVAGLPHLRVRDAVAGAVGLALAFAPVGIPRIPRSETFYEIAVDLDQDGKPGEALRFFEQAEALDPRNPDILLSHGLALVKTGREEEGRRLLERAAALDPGADLAWQALGVYWRRHGDVAKARECLERAVAADPCNRRAHALLADLYLDLGRPDDARRELAEARRVHPRPDRTVLRVSRRYEALLRRLHGDRRPSTGRAGTDSE